MCGAGNWGSTAVSRGQWCVPPPRLRLWGVFDGFWVCVCSGGLPTVRPRAHAGEGLCVGLWNWARYQRRVEMGATVRSRAVGILMHGRWNTRNCSQSLGSYPS